MSHQIPESELIINSDGSVYHLGIKPQELPDLIFLVGDPNRVPLVSQYFDSVDIEINKREFRTHIGTLKNTRLAVLSTGIGGDNIDIVLNELNLLKNADLSRRIWNPSKSPLQLIRLGTSGSVNPAISVDSLLVSKTAIGLDGLAWYYSDDENIQARDFVASCQWPKNRNTPYQTSASSLLLEKITSEFIQGQTLTASGFYRPQGRILHGLPDETSHWKTWLNAGVDNVEMETAAIYFLSKAFGFDALSLNAILANRANGAFSQDANTTIDRMIRLALNIFVPS